MRSDEELMQAYLHGDTCAFVVLYHRYEPVLKRVMERYLSSAHDVEDVVQLSFLKLHRARGSYRIGTPVRPWLFMIARNVRRDHLRTSKRRAFERVAADEISTFEDPMEKLERDERVVDLHAALEQLSRTLHRTVELHWLEDRDFEDIARSEGVLQGTVRVRAHRACAQLREWMQAPRSTAA